MTNSYTPYNKPEGYSSVQRSEIHMRLHRINNSMQYMYNDQLARKWRASQNTTAQVGAASVSYTSQAPTPVETQPRIQPQPQEHAPELAADSHEYALPSNTPQNAEHKETEQRLADSRAEAAAAHQAAENTSGSNF